MMGCDVGPLSIVYDATSHNNNAAIVGFLGGLQAVQWRQKNVSYYKTNITLQEMCCGFLLSREMWYRKSVLPGTGAG